jgi:hypothetical protein
VTAHDHAAMSHEVCVAAGRPAGASQRDLVYSRCPRKHREPPTNGAETIRHRALLCFTDEELRLDAGEALGSIEPGQRFRGRRRIVLDNFHTAIGNIERSLRVARRFADAETGPTVDRIIKLAHAGIQQIRRHPWRIVRGGIAPFHRADAIAQRAGLRHCLS